MRRRHLPNPFTQHDDNNLPVEQSYIPIGRAVVPENGSFVSPPDNTLRGGLHVDSQWNLEGMATEYPSSGVSMEMQHHAPAFSGPPYDPYLPSSVTGNVSLEPANNVGHVPSSHYNVRTIRDSEGGLLDFTSGMRGPFKRKSPGIAGTCDRGSSSSFYCPGSSSSSSSMLMEKPTADGHRVPLYRGNSLSVPGEDSMRNVRRRSQLETEPTTTRSHFSSYSSYRYHSTCPENHSGPIHAANLNADTTSTEWNSAAPYAAAHYGRAPTQGISGTSHETSQFLVGGSATDGAYHHDSIFNRHPVSSVQHLNGPHAQATREGHSNHFRRATPSYRCGLSYSHLGHGATSSTNGVHSFSESYSSRYSRNSSAGGWHNSYKNGRSRIAVERFQPIVEAALDRMGTETLMTADRASFYGGSRNLFDHYRDMRLDIDSMSYEELLSLEERIGNVNTGLSEDSMSKRVMEKVHCSLDPNHEEVTCPICLEEYKNGEKIGTMKKCGHGYHVDCIKKWLLMKNVCPICKSECSN